MPLRLGSSPCFCGACEERARGVLPGSGRGPGRPAWGEAFRAGVRAKFSPLGDSPRFLLDIAIVADVNPKLRRAVQAPAHADFT